MNVGRDAWFDVPNVKRTTLYCAAFRLGTPPYTAPRSRHRLYSTSLCVWSCPSCCFVQPVPYHTLPVPYCTAPLAHRLVYMFALVLAHPRPVLDVSPSGRAYVERPWCHCVHIFIPLRFTMSRIPFAHPNPSIHPYRHMGVRLPMGEGGAVVAVIGFPIHPPSSAPATSIHDGLKVGALVTG